VKRRKGEDATCSLSAPCRLCAHRAHVRAEAVRPRAKFVRRSRYAGTVGANATRAQMRSAYVPAGNTLARLPFRH